MHEYIHRKDEKHKIYYSHYKLRGINYYLSLECQSQTVLFPTFAEKLCLSSLHREGLVAFQQEEKQDLNRDYCSPHHLRREPEGKAEVLTFSEARKRLVNI